MSAFFLSDWQLYQIGSCITDVLNLISAVSTPD